MALAFAGTAPFGAAILAGLVEPPAGRVPRDVALVVSQPDRPAGRGRKVRSSAVVQYARQHDLELLQPERTHDDDVLARLRELGVETIVVAAFGQMIREPLLSEFLMLNVHGSLLPAYRGAAPVERAIMEGLDETGVGIMRMEAGLDTGPVAREARVDIGPDDDAGMLYERLAAAGVELLHDALDAAAAGTLSFADQPEDGATYAHKIVAADRVLDLSQPAGQLHNRVRALSPHIGAYVELDDERLTLWRTRLPSGDENAAAAEVRGKPGAVAARDGRLLLGAGDGALEVLEVQPAGKRRMPAADWLRGLREPPIWATVASPD